MKRAAYRLSAAVDSYLSRGIFASARSHSIRANISARGSTHSTLEQIRRDASRGAQFSTVPCFLNSVDMTGAHELIAEEDHPAVTAAVGLLPHPG
jgi:hypothetical protein